MVVTPAEITDGNREAVLALRVAPGQEQFVGSLIDERYQGRGYGSEVVRQIAELVRAEGATELLTSYVPQDGGRGPPAKVDAFPGRAMVCTVRQKKLELSRRLRTLFALPPDEFGGSAQRFGGTCRVVALLGQPPGGGDGLLRGGE